MTAYPSKFLTAEGAAECYRILGIPSPLLAGGEVDPLDPAGVMSGSGADSHPSRESAATGTLARSTVAVLGSRIRSRGPRLPRTRIERCGQ